MSDDGLFTGRPDHLLQIQRLAGNAAAFVAVQRQSDARTAAPAVRAGRLINSGSGQLGNPLGFHGVGWHFTNGVEVIFDLDPGAAAYFSGLQPRQWSGPEAEYFKTGHPAFSPWQTKLRGPGGGADDPLPQNQRVTDKALIFYDSPGPSAFGHRGHTWIYAVQNFTCWVEGRPKMGGATRRLTEVLSWHSVISVVNPDAAGDAGDPGRYTETSLTRSGTGWVATDLPNV
ncbi:hypothetical protein [Rhodococcus koreensis]